MKYPTYPVNIRRGTECDEYIGRGPGGRDMTETPIGQDGWLGNPYRIKSAGGDYTRAESIDRFEDVFADRFEDDPAFRVAIQALAGDRLGCYCAPKACHGDVIAKYIHQTRVLDF
jgi:hypothetical protein